MQADGECAAVFMRVQSVGTDKQPKNSGQRDI